MISSPVPLCPRVPVRPASEPSQQRPRGPWTLPAPQTLRWSCVRSDQGSHGVHWWPCARPGSTGSPIREQEWGEYILLEKFRSLQIMIETEEKNKPLTVQIPENSVLQYILVSASFKLPLRDGCESS